MSDLQFTFLVWLIALSNVATTIALIRAHKRLTLAFRRLVELRREMGLAFDPVLHEASRGRDENAI